MKRTLSNCILLITVSMHFTSSHYRFRVMENRPPDTFVGMVTIKPGSIYKFLDKENLFTFNSNDGIIRTRKNIDRELLSPDVIEVFLFEQKPDGRFVETITIQVRIIDLNDNPPIFYPDKIERTLAENIAIFTDISLVVAKDADTEEFGVANNYRIILGNEDDKFSLEGVGVQYRGQLLLRVIKPLDREIRDRYSLTISVEDKGQPPLTGTLLVEIIVEDYNDNNPVFSQTKYSVQINESSSPGQEVVQVFATDADIELNKIVEYRFKKTGSTSENEFSIDPHSGIIKLTRRITCHLSQGVCTLVVEAFDHGSPSLSAYCYVTINVIKINYFSPQLKISYVNSADGVAYIEIGKITRRPLAIIHCQDDDQDSRDLISLSISAGNEGNLFVLERTHGNIYIFKQMKKIKQDQIHQYIVTLKAVDGGIPPKTAMETLMIRVNKANMHHPIFRTGEQTVTLPNNLAIHSFVATFFASDNDSGPNGKISYSISNGKDDDIFTIDRDSGLITLAKELWFIKYSKITLKVVARDSGISSLQTVGYLHVIIQQSPYLHARFKSKCKTNFTVLSDRPINLQNELFLYDFNSQLELSDNSRRDELEILITNEMSVRSDFFISSNGSFYMSTNCQVPETHIFNVVLLHRLKILHRIPLYVTLSPAISDILCNIDSLIYYVRLPELFQYNMMVFDVSKVHHRHFSGDFIDISSKPTGLVVSPHGEVYWRSFSFHQNPIVTVVKYQYTHETKIIFQKISIYFYRNFLESSLINCRKLKMTMNNRPGLIYLKEMNYNDIANIKFSLFPTHYVQLLDEFLVIRDQFYLSSHSPRRISLVAFNSDRFQICEINFPNEVNFSEENYYFRTNKNEKNGFIGKIKLVGNITSITVNISGKYCEYFHYSINEMSLFLNKSIENKIDAKLMRIGLSIIGSTVLSKAEVSIEFIPSLVSPIFSEPFYTFIIPENSLTHVPLKKIYLDSSQDIMDYKLNIIEQSSFGKWSIFPDGFIYLLSELDYEERKDFVFSILAYNKMKKEKYSKVLINILVQDCNDNSPKFTANPYYLEISKNAEVHTYIGKVFAMDADAELNGLLSYKITPMISELQFLEINEMSGEIKTNALIDATVKQLQFRVVASDHGNPSLNSSTKVYLRIHSNTEDNSHIFPQLFYKYVPENATIGHRILNVKTTSKSKIVYQITKCSHKGMFSVNSSTGSITLIGSLDREKIEFYVLTITATDSLSVYPSNIIAMTNVRIRVLDINDNAPMFLNNSLQTIGLSESTAIGTIIGTFVAEDIDEGLNGIVRYRITGSELDLYSVFKIDSFSGKLYLNQILDYEHKSHWVFNVTAFDMGMPQRNSNLSITVSVFNMNDNIPRFSEDFLTPFTVRQDAPHGTTVERIHASDPDKNEIVYYLAAMRPPKHSFAIDMTSGILSVVKSIPSEESYNIIIMAAEKDRKDRFDYQSLKVNIKNDNDVEVKIFTHGVIILPKTVFIGEKIATIEAQYYPEFKNYRLLYSIMNSSLDKIIINQNTGDIFIHSDNPVQFISIDLTILVSLESLQSENIYTYHSSKLIIDQDEYHNLNFQKNEYILQISECESVMGSKLIRLQALYPGNPISDLQYFINNVYCGISERIKLPNTIMNLDKDSGWLSIGQSNLDREQIDGSQITIEVVVVDRGRNASRIRSTKVFLNIMDCNDNPPVFSNETFVFRIPENTSLSQTLYVGTVTASDDDLYSQLIYSWVEGNSSWFTLNNASGIITSTGISFDYEVVPYYFLKLQVSDGKFVSTANVLIIIEDINDKCLQFSKDNYHFQLHENAPIHTIIGQVTLSNPYEKPVKQKFTIISDWASNLFSVHSDHGIITTLGVIDYEQDDNYIMLITGALKNNEAFILPCVETVTTTIMISIINANDNLPVFENNGKSISIYENITIGSSIFQFIATDGDSTDLLKFEIISPNEELFSINPLNGVLYTSGKLDFEKAEKHTVTVVCSDGKHYITAEVEVLVINTNDEIPVIHNEAQIYVPLNKGQQFIFIKCSDRDNLGPLNYGIIVYSQVRRIVLNRSNGEITINSNIYDTKLLNVTLTCSDNIHVTSKNVTFLFEDTDNYSKVKYVEIFIESFDPNSVWKIQNLVKSSINSNEKYKFMLTGLANDSKNTDWNLFHINFSTAEVRPISGFYPRKFQYQFTIVAYAILMKINSLQIIVTIKYRNINQCNPRYIGTPYIFKIQNPVRSLRSLGSVTIGYCLNFSISYYLSSGQSFFNVNISNGQLFVMNSPPVGRFRFKVTSIIMTNPKTFLSTVITVLTTGPRLKQISCQFRILRIVLSVTTEIGTHVGNVLIKNLPTNTKPEFFKLSRNWPLSISKSGQLFLKTKLKYLDEEPLILHATVGLRNQNEIPSLQCQIEVILSQTISCILSLTYPNSFIELQTFTDNSIGRFIFGIPVAHQSCKLQLYNVTYQLSNKIFYIKKGTGEIMTGNVLSKSTYSLSVRISSPNAIADIVVPLQISVFEKLDNVNIIYDQMPSYIVLDKNIKIGSVIGSFRAKTDPSTYQSSLTYSLVYFCCVYPSNIAVYDSSIYQSFFQISHLTGDVVIIKKLPKARMDYILRIRVNIKTENPRKYFYSDTDLIVNYNDIPCRCNHVGYFSENIEENSEPGTVIVRNVLRCSNRKSQNILLYPEWIRKLVYYDVATNEIKTAQDSLDREKYEYLDVLLNITDESRNIVESCPGIINIVDLNDNAPRFTLNYFMGSIPENSPIGTWIIDIGVVDMDSKKFPLKYTLSQIEKNVFSINSENGSVFLTGLIDREEKSRYEMKVAVSDGIHALETGMLIVITDVNDNRPRISPGIDNHTFVINKSEFKEGNVHVTTISASDNDDPLSNNSKIWYSLSSETSKIPIKMLLLIDENLGDLIIVPEILHWISPNETIDVLITATDKGNPPLSDQAIIHILFINSEWELKLSRSAHEEPVAVLYTETAGSKVLSLSVEHSDQFNKVSFRIVNGNGTQFFSIEPQTGHINATHNINSAVIGTWFSLIIQACGYRRFLTYSFCSRKETIKLVISDFNLYSPQLRNTQTMLSILENTQVGTTLFQMNIVDADVGIAGIIRIKILQPLSGEFSVPPSSNNIYHLVLTKPLDYEKQQQYSLVILIHDLGSPRRSQISNILINVLDEDDNAPFFTEQSFVFRVIKLNESIPLPSYHDDDSDMVFKEPVLKLESNYSKYMQLHQFKSKYFLKILQPIMNVTMIPLVLRIFGSTPEKYSKSLPPGRYQNLNIYLLLSDLEQRIPKCSYMQKVSRNLIEFIPSTEQSFTVKHQHIYHVLLSHPKSEKQYLSLNKSSGIVSFTDDSSVSSLLVSISNNRLFSHVYQICHLKLVKRKTSDDSCFTLIAKDLFINKDINAGETVGKVIISCDQQSRPDRFNYRLYSNHYLPFSISESGDIVSEINIYSNYPVAYNVEIRATFPTEKTSSIVRKFVIYVETNKTSNNVLAMSVNVRENIGEGAVLGSIMSILHDKTLRLGSFALSKEFSESQGRIVVDKKGIIRVKKLIDREIVSKIQISILADFRIKTEVIELTILVKDENDKASRSNDVNIMFSVIENTSRFTKLARLIPGDEDTIGNYRCKLNSLDVPVGIFLTPDCWLYILNPSLISMWKNQSHIQVIHHDGVHKAVLSKFRLKSQFIPQSLVEKKWVILKLFNYVLDSLIKNLKSMKNLLVSLNISVFLLSIDHINGLVFLWCSQPSRADIIKIAIDNKLRLEETLECKIAEITENLCEKNTCNSHGACSTVVKMSENVFTDDNSNSKQEIIIYHSISTELKCVCDEGYLGKTCNISARCNQQVCQNGGLCGSSADGQEVCECPWGYTGQLCEQDINECENTNLCRPYGVCINIPGGFKCECHIYWIGNSLCTQPMNFCLSNPCSVTGSESCIPILGGFLCKCKFGYYGDKCQNFAISLQAQSFLEYELQVNQISFEFATIIQDSPLITVILSPAIIIRVSLSSGCISFAIFENAILTSQKVSKKFVSNSHWWKVEFSFHSDSVSVLTKSCGNLNSCEATNEMFIGSHPNFQLLRLLTEKFNIRDQFRVILGSSHNIKMLGSQYFVGCLRHLQFYGATIIRKEERHVVHDSCPRYRNGSAPCSDSELKCNGIGRCVDEWFTSRCECPNGYQPPACTPGYSAFSISPNTIILYVRRPDSLSNQNFRKKRAIVQDSSMISMKLKTRDTNCIILVALTSFHSYTSVQLENGYIKLVDKYGGSLQDMQHSAIRINDNRIHAVTVTRHYTGTVTVTVDSIIAQVNWLQSHDIIGPSVHTLYLAGLPTDLQTENALNIPNFSGCISEIRFNNQTMPLEGLTRSFNVSILQGSISTGCSSDVCLQPGICDKYQICEETYGIPHGIWGQYKCVDDKNHRLLLILLPILISVLFCVILIVFIILLMKHKSRLLKNKSVMDHSKEMAIQHSKSYRKPKFKYVPNEVRDLIQLKSHGKPSHSTTSSTLLMAKFDKGNISHPDLMDSHEVKFEPMNKGANSLYYHDATLLNPYMSSGNIMFPMNFDSKTVKLPKHCEQLNFKNQNFSVKPVDDSLVYNCSHPDVYEPLGSNISSNISQDLLNYPKFPFAYQFQTQGVQSDFFGHNNFISESNFPRTCDIRQSSSSSSNNSHDHLGNKIQSARRRILSEKRNIDDVFSNTESNLTASPKIGMSLDSLSSSTNSQNVFTATNSSDSIQSTKNCQIQNTINCWKNIQRALPPPPPAEEHYE